MVITDSQMCVMQRRKTSLVLGVNLSTLLQGKKKQEEYTTAQAHANRWEARFKLNILEFQGCLQPE